MATATATAQAVGKIVQIIGPVVDVEFEAGHLPEIYNALSIKSDTIDIVAEVEQHLGENRVRAVAMKPTDGLQRGMKAVDLGGPITDAGGATDARPRAERARRAGGLSRSSGRVERALADSPSPAHAAETSRPT